MKKTALFLIAVAGVWGGVASAYDDNHALLTPKAKEQQAALKSVPGTTTDMVDRSLGEGTPKSRDVAYSMRKVPASGPEIDMASAPRPVYAPKDPRYEVALRDNAIREVEVAPLK
jgi:hypothetical protein